MAFWGDSGDRGPYSPYKPLDCSSWQQMKQHNWYFVGLIHRPPKWNNNAKSINMSRRYRSCVYYRGIPGSVIKLQFMTTTHTFHYVMLSHSFLSTICVRIKLSTRHLHKVDHVIHVPHVTLRSLFAYQTGWQLADYWSHRVWWCHIASSRWDFDIIS